MLIHGTALRGCLYFCIFLLYNLNMSDIKALFFDIDHTLFSHSQNCVPPAVWKTLVELKEKGMKLFIATGRQYEDMKTLPVDWSLFDGFVTLNGAVNLDKDLNTISSFPITGKARENACRLFDECRIPFVVVERNRMYANFYDDGVYETQKQFGTPLLPPVGKTTDEDIFQLIFFIDRDREGIIANALEGCVLSRWNDSAVDATSPLAGKDRGVKALLDRFGYGDENCIVFGDGGNDIPMLRAFSNSVAMGNARDEVREAASFVTSHIDEDGILNALRHFGVIS